MANATVGGSSSAVVMDDPQAYKLLLTCPRGLLRHQISVDFQDLYDRIPHPDANLETSVNELWDQRVQLNVSLYNGTKFRYGGHSMRGEGVSVRDPIPCLHLGLTDYRTFVGTNLNPTWVKFLVQSKEDSVRCQHMSSPLGNGAVVETSDNKILLLQRSNNVGEFPGHFVFPGGHPEPKEVRIVSHQCEKNVYPGSLKKKISTEMFESIVREVVEEIGVPTASLSDPIFMGISVREMNVRPAAFFFIQCNLPSEDIQQFYVNAQDGYESTKLFAVSKNEVEEMTSRMPGCHRGGFALYELMLKAKEDV